MVGHKEKPDEAADEKDPCDHGNEDARSEIHWKPAHEGGSDEIDRKSDPQMDQNTAVEAPRELCYDVPEVFL